MGFDDESDMDMDDIEPEMPKDDAPLGRRVKPITNESVLKLLDKCGKSKKKIVTEMYNRGGESRKKVIDLARKIK